MLSTKFEAYFISARKYCLYTFLIFAFIAYSFSSFANSKKTTSGGASDASHPKLKAGGIHAELPLQKKGQNYARGAFAIAEIKLFNRGKRRSLHGELVFETQGAKIKSISNLGKTSRRSFRVIKKDGKYTARFYNLRKRTPQILWVELKLSDEGQTEEKAADNLLTVTLLNKTIKKNVLSDTTQVSWRIANCASAYHKALVKIGEDQLPLMSSSLNHLVRSDKSLPGRWYFKPKKQYQKVTSYRSVCRRHKYKRVKSTGKWKKYCVAYRKVKRTKYKLIASLKDVQPAFNSASRFVYARGSDPQLRRNTGNYWVTTKVTQDIKRYLTQKSNPALCTGAPQLTEYYDRKFSQIRKRAEKARDDLAKAKEQIPVKTAEFLKLLENHKLLAQQESEDAADQAEDQEVKVREISLVLSDEEKAKLPKTSLSEALGKLIEQVKDAELSDTFETAKTPLEQLKVFSKQFNAYKTSLGLDNKLAARLRVLLSLIEATHYLEIADRRYDSLSTSISGSLQSIRDAHKQHCSCVL